MAVRQFRISIFPPKAKLAEAIANNGIVLDSICTKCSTTEECSNTGDYTLDANFVNDGSLSLNIYEDCILKVLEDYGYEIFRVVKCNPKLKEKSVMAKQITIEEQKTLWLNDVRPTKTGANSAVNIMLNGSVGTKEIIVSSNINKTGTAYYELVDFYTACFDCDQSFTNRWGAEGLEVIRRQNKIYFNKSRGLKKNLTVRERKNLTGFSGNANIESYVTRGIGQGYNGIKGHYIESPKKDQYSRIKTKVFKYEDIKVRTEDMTQNEQGLIFSTLEEAQAELDKRVKLEFSENHVDDIAATYNVDFIQLQNTEEYKEYGYLEKADCGDYVKVNIPTLNIDITVRVMKKTYDVLRQRTSDIQLSNLPIQASVSTTNIINSLKKEYLNTGNDNLNKYVTAMLKAGLQNSNVILRSNEILIMDTKDINTAKNVWRWNGKALAHSNDGYYSDSWNVGITQDGVINADMILAGVLTAITIQNSDGSFVIDLSTSGGCNFFNNGKLALKIYNNLIEFYNWGTGGNYIGSLGSTTTNGDPNGNPSLEWWHNPNLSTIRIGFKDDDNTFIKPYIVFDKGLRENSQASIEIKRETAMSNHLNMNGQRFYLDKSEYANLYLGISTLGWLWCNGGLVTAGDIECKGNKKCVQQTLSFGNVPFYATEDMSSYLTWTLEEGIYLKTKPSKSGDYFNCIVKIPDITQETINTKMGYDVVYYKYGPGDIWTSKITEKFFIVHSNYPVKFRFTLRGIRKNFENNNFKSSLEDSKKQLEDKIKKLNTKNQQKIAASQWLVAGECYEG